MRAAQVVLLSVLAACVYGVIHDQVTVRLCPEYFTIAHPPLFHTKSPTLLAACWGIAATAGIGAALGFILALVSQSDGSAPFSLTRLARSVLFLLIVMATSAFAAGVLGYLLSRDGFMSLPADLASAIPVYQHDRFMSVWFAHGASYLVGLSGGVLLCLRIWLARGRPSVISFFPPTPASTIRAGLLAAVVAYIFWIRFGPH